MALLGSTSGFGSGPTIGYSIEYDKWALSNNYHSCEFKITPASSGNSNYFGQGYTITCKITIGTFSSSTVIKNSNTIWQSGSLGTVSIGSNTYYKMANPITITLTNIPLISEKITFEFTRESGGGSSGAGNATFNIITTKPIGITMISDFGFYGQPDDTSGTNKVEYSIINKDSHYMYIGSDKSGTLWKKGNGTSFYIDIDRSSESLVKEFYIVFVKIDAGNSIKLSTSAQSYTAQFTVPRFKVEISKNIPGDTAFSTYDSSLGSQIAIVSAREGFELLGLDEIQNATDPAYPTSDYYFRWSDYGKQLNGKFVYYIWKEISKGSCYIFNGSSWVPAQPYIYNGSSWVPATAYIFNGSSWIKGIT